MMINEPVEVSAAESSLIAAQIEDVFKFISDPETRVDPVTPLDARRKIKDDSGQDSLGECELKIAGRVLHYEILSTVFEPPTRLVAEMRGDVIGEQKYILAEETGGTRLNLELKFVVPLDWPSYYREEPTRGLFAETLVSQTLANIKSALETESAS
jgi:hypothetical protein